MDMAQMKKGMRVTWTLKNGEVGLGTAISDEDDGHLLVAVDPLPPDASWAKQSSKEFHPVIFCATTWLRPV
jgi:hypothetical protein